MQQALDLQVSNHGSVWTIQPLSDDGRAWVDDNLQAEPWQWMGNAVVIEARYVGAIVDGAIEDGLTVG